jgi:hypothetical protein
MTIQVLHSEMAGAPALAGSIGTLAALLKACLTDGFNTNTLDSLVVASDVATGTKAGGMVYTVGSKVRIAGATPAGLNGDWVVLTASGTNFTFATSGIANQTATGTITAKTAPLGWDNPFSGTNIEVFRSPNVLSPRHYLRVEDQTLSYGARVVAYHTMSDVNTGVDPYPSAAQVSGGVHWAKSSALTAATCPWVLIGDDRTFYYIPAYSRSRPSAIGYGAVGFGDIESLVPGDVAHSALTGCPVSYSNYASGTDPTVNHVGDIDQLASEFYIGQYAFTGQLGTYMAKGYSGFGVSTPAWRWMDGFVRLGAGTQPVWRSGHSSRLMTYPGGADNGLYLARVAITENSGAQLRGYFRGFYVPTQAVGPSVFNLLEAVTGIAGLPGRTVRMINSGLGCFGIDVVGPW